MLGEPCVHIVGVIIGIVVVGIGILVGDYKYKYK